MMLNGDTLGVVDELGSPIIDKSFLLLLNAYHEPVDFTLPPSPQGRPWKCLLKTSDLEKPFCSGLARKRIKLEGRSLILLSERKARKATSQD
jgi:glycogen operon protein